MEQMILWLELVAMINSCKSKVLKNYYLETMLRIRILQ